MTGVCKICGHSFSSWNECETICPKCVYKESFGKDIICPTSVYTMLRQGMTYKEAHTFLEVKQREMTKNRNLYNEKAININGLAILALEKQIPEKPINVEKHYYRCPCCKQVLDVSDDDIFVYENLTPMYCSKCGQALDWSDTE